MTRTLYIDGTRYDCELEGDDGAWGFKRVTPEPDDATYERLCDENERTRVERERLMLMPA